MEIMGHRGAKGLAPENSIESIRRAIACNVDMIEVDVRMQGSSVVLSHNATSRHKAYCTLKHALNEIDGKIPFNIEIKEMGVIKHLPSLLKKYKGEILYSSTKYIILKNILNEFPTANIAVIEKWSGLRAITFASLLKTNRIHINQKWLWHSLVVSLVNQGYKIYAYTVNEKERADELAKWGVQGICTDFPDKFK